MNEVVNLEYFRKKYNIPVKQYVEHILTSPDRTLLEIEAKYIINIIKPMLGKYEDNIVLERNLNEKTLTEEWIGDAT
jgi:hypothetical protein